MWASGGRMEEGGAACGGGASRWDSGGRMEGGAACGGGASRWDLAGRMEEGRRLRRRRFALGGGWSAAALCATSRC